MSIRFVVAAVAAIGVGACSLYGGLDGFSSGDPTDGGTSTTDDGSPLPNDASTSPDVDTMDSAPNDAGIDARYCSPASSAALCTDFDDPTTPLAAWIKSSSGAADVALVSTGAHSAPNAIRATAGASGANRWAYYSRNVSNATVESARVSYAVLVEQRPSTNEIEVNGVVFMTSTNNHEFYLAVTSSGAYIVEQTANVDGSGLQTNYHDLGAAIPTGTWVRITLEVVLSGSTKTLALSVDGSEITRKALTVTGPGRPVMRAGLTYAATTTTGGVVLVDDMRFDALP